MLERIASAKADTALPQERELAEEFVVSRTTVRHALQSLADDGLIYSIRGQGTFVSESRISKGTSLSSFGEDMRSRGMEPSSRVLTAVECPSTTAVARQLKLKPGAPIIFIERLRLADGFPMCLEELYLPAHLFPRLLAHDLNTSLYAVMAEHYRVRVTRAQQRITATNITGRTADLLGVPARSAALSATRRGIDSRGRLVEYAESLYRADRYDFAFSIQR